MSDKLTGNKEWATNRWLLSVGGYKTVFLSFAFWSSGLQTINHVY